MSDASLFDETFLITSINSAKYDRVSRIATTSANHEISMTLDLNTELFPVAVNDKLTVSLATSLKLDGSKEDDSTAGWRAAGAGEASLADMYDYVCRGKVYRFEEGTGGNL
ncbi:hypothetical protein MRB53_038941 [Persea americana]|nr:hypothetical protein MRB53_038941 [Persea americana]